MVSRQSAGLLVLSCCAVLLATCGSGDQEPPAEAPGRPLVLTTFYPTTYFVERIAGDLVEVRCPLPEGADPIFWTPSAEHVAAYQGADLVVLNGASFEKWVEKVSLPESRVVRTAHSFEKEWLRYRDTATHSHGPAGEHTHEGTDGHTWLDPVNAKAQAGAILAALTKLLPGRKSRLEEGYAGLARDLDALHESLSEIAAGYGGEPVLASHPAYNYLAKRYGFRIANLDLDPDSKPDDLPLDGIRAALQQSPARHLLWESPPAAGVAERIREELGLVSAVISPCELPSAADIAAKGDYLAVMRANIERLRPVVSGED